LGQVTSDVRALTLRLQQGLKAYEKHLRTAMETYGRGFNDPIYNRTLPGFGQDIQTGNPEETERIKLAVFASMIKTAGVRLDPGPFRYWAEIQNLIDKARSYNANSCLSTNRDKLPFCEAAVKQLERERDRAQAAGPAQLTVGQTFVTQATDGPNFQVNLFGVQLGRALANVRMLAQLTYLGKIESGDLFLLTALTSVSGKTRVDTLVEPRAIMVYSDTHDSLRYGYAVTNHDYSGYTAASARIADVADDVHDWVWKRLSASDAVQPTSTELEDAVAELKDSHRAIEEAIKAFLRLASQAMLENDSALLAGARVNHEKARLPEADLRTLFSEVRAKLYATRALCAGDARFLAALDAVASARREAENRIQHGQELFGYFNRIPVHAAPDLPWKRIDKLGADFMNAADDARRAGKRSDRLLPHVPQGNALAVAE